MNNDIEKTHHRTFEDIKQLTSDNMEFWFARELQFVLNYATCDKFKRLIEKAIIACHNSGQDEHNHFSLVGKMVDIGSGSQREIEDFKLSRYACYLIVQNGDPTKPVIAKGQTYFAIQTRRQELADDETFRQLKEDEKLRREDIQGKSQANITHYEVEKKVRRTIEELGGTMPENLPTPDLDLKKLEKHEKTTEKRQITDNKTPKGGKG